jgi:hypothetical protein
MANHQKIEKALKKVFDKIGLPTFINEQKQLEKKLYDLLSPTVKNKEEDENYFIILQRYNSFTPALPRRDEEEFPDAEVIKGGGYYLRWKGKGIVIDPGFNFIENLVSADLSIGDIDAVMITHGHNDHYIDLDPILTLLYQFNESTKDNYLGIKNFLKEKWDIALDYFMDALDFPVNNRISHLGMLLCMHHKGLINLGDKVYENRKLLETEYEILREIYPEERFKKKIDLFLGRSAQKTVDSFLPLSFEQINNIYLLNPTSKREFKDYNMILEAASSKHTDLYGKSHCIGIVFHLLENKEVFLKMGITSDTGYYYTSEKIDHRITDRNLSQWFLGCELLIAHIGSILETEFGWLDLSDKERSDDKSLKPYLYQNHLGILGLIKLITEIDSLKLVIISEYGEEMSRIRTLVTEGLNEVFQPDPTSRTGDIGLKIIFSKPLKIAINDKPVDPSDVEEKEKQGRIIYKERN